MSGASQKRRAKVVRSFYENPNYFTLKELRSKYNRSSSHVSYLLGYENPPEHIQNRAGWTNRLMGVIMTDELDQWFMKKISRGYGPPKGYGKGIPKKKKSIQ